MGNLLVALCCIRESSSLARVLAGLANRAKKNTKLHVMLSGLFLDQDRLEWDFLDIDAVEDDAFHTDNFPVMLDQQNRNALAAGTAAAALDLSDEFEDVITDNPV